MNPEPQPQRVKRDPREGMTCCVCGRTLLRIEWPQNAADQGVCDQCLNGDVAA